METIVSWIKNNNSYQRVEGNFSNVKQVPTGIYNIEISRTGWYLDKYADKFTFDYKMYGLQTEFCKHVLKTYENTTGNFGIMLTGTKGTGKTVTAKTLANDFNLPIIIVKDMGENNQDMIEFIGKFNFDCVLFFDEFEKNFREADSTVLQIMDGVYNSMYRKIFLLTSNELTVNENLLGRPSRLRYVRKFGNLELKTVEEYLDDNLQVPEARQNLIDYIDTLTISTIDILKTIVNEVNIHGMEGLTRAKEFFNVSVCNYEYTCIRGYMYKDEILENTEKYSINNFAKEAEKVLNPKPHPCPGVPYEQLSEEQRKELEEYRESNIRNFYSVQKEYIDSPIKFKNLKNGDKFNEDEIVSIDFKKKIIVTADEDCYYYYYITNSDNKPSLYSSKVLRNLF